MITAHRPLIRYRGRRRFSAEPYELPVIGSLAAARWGTLIAGLAAFVSAVIGLQFGSQALYASDDLLLVQMYGQDLVTLVVVLPTLLISVGRAAHGSARGLTVWTGALTYLAYWYHYMLGAAAFTGMFMVHATLVGASLFSLGVIGASLDIQRFAHRFDSHLPARAMGAVLIGAGTLFAGAALLDVSRRVYSGEELGGAIRGVYSVDLTVMLPLTVVAGVLLWKRHSWGLALAGPLFVNAALSVTTILVAALVLLQTGLPVGDAVAMLIAPTVILVGLAGTYLRRTRV